MNNKLRKQRAHALQRARLRYGSDGVSVGLLNRVSQMIRSGQSRPVGRLNNRLSQHEVDVDGRTYSIVYDRQSHTIATFLPQHAITQCPDEPSEA